MLSKEFLKKLGIFGVSFGLIASPLTFAGSPEEEEEQEPIPQEETVPEATGATGYDSTEYENEEEEIPEEEELPEEEEDSGW